MRLMPVLIFEQRRRMVVGVGAAGMNKRHLVDVLGHAGKISDTHAPDLPVLRKAETATS